MIWKLWKKSPDNPLNQVSPRLLFWEFLVYFQTHDILCKKISISFFCHHLFFCVYAHLLMVICMDLVSNTDQLVSDTIYSVVLAKELVEGPPFKTTLIVWFTIEVWIDFLLHHSFSMQCELVRIVHQKWSFGYKQWNLTWSNGWVSLTIELSFYPMDEWGWQMNNYSVKDTKHPFSWVLIRG